MCFFILSIIIFVVIEGTFRRITCSLLIFIHLLPSPSVDLLVTNAKAAWGYMPMNMKIYSTSVNYRQVTMNVDSMKACSVL
jgi:hypothetical protein